VLVWNFCPIVFLYLSKSYFLFCLFTIYSAVPFKNLFTLSSRCCNFASHIDHVIHDFVTQVTNCDFPSVQDLSMHPATTAGGLRTSFGTNAFHVICIRFFSKLIFYAPPFLFLFVFIDIGNLIYFWILDLILSQSNNKHVVVIVCLFMSLSHIIEPLCLITQSTCAACFNLQKLSILPRKRFYGFFIVPRINSNCLSKEHSLVASCNGEIMFCETCLVQFVRFGN